MRVLAGWSKGGVAGLAGVLIWATIMLFTQVISPPSLWQTFEPSLPVMRHGGDGTLHWLGTDHIGRDALAHIVWGARATILASIVAAVGSMLFSAVPIVALVGGIWMGNRAVTRIAHFAIDAMYSIPALVCYIVLIGVFPIGISVCIATAVVVTSHARERVLAVHKVEERLSKREGGHLSRCGWLLADLVERVRMAFVIIASVQFVGLWRDWGLGYYVAQTRPYLGVDAGPCLLSVMAIFTILVPLVLLERGLSTF